MQRLRRINKPLGIRWKKQKKKTTSLPSIPCKTEWLVSRDPEHPTPCTFYRQLKGELKFRTLALTCKEQEEHLGDLAFLAPAGE